MSSRYFARRVLTNEILDVDLPLIDPQPEWALSATGSLRAMVSPSLAHARTSDGRLLLEEWGTELYLERDGALAWGGVVRRTGADMSLEAESFAGYLHGLPFEEYYRISKADPAAILRHLWQRAQAAENARLGVVVNGSTPVRIGTDSDLAVASAEADLDAAKRAVTEREKAARAARDALARIRETAARDLRVLRDRLNAASSDAEKDAIRAQIDAREARRDADIAAADRTVDARSAELDSARTAREARQDDLSAAKDQLSEDGGPYELAWWDSPDLGTEVDRLAADTPFDFVERHRWAGSGNDIEHSIDVHYPRVGRKRTDLDFTEGVNIIGVDTPERRGEGFANVAIGLGAGDGRGSLRHTAAVNDGRLRRATVIDLRDVTSKRRLERITREEQRIRAETLHIDRIRVVDHEHARIGSWQLGDDILVKTNTALYGWVEQWCRIVSWKLTTPSTAELSLRRSDAFSYGSTTT